MPGEDFVQVRLTKFGEKLAAGSQVNILSGQHHFVFKAGEIQRVTRAFDWMLVLSLARVDDRPLFEIAPAKELPKTQEK